MCIVWLDVVWLGVVWLGEVCGMIGFCVRYDVPECDV